MDAGTEDGSPVLIYTVLRASSVLRFSWSRKERFGYEDRSRAESVEKYKFVGVLVSYCCDGRSGGDGGGDGGRSQPTLIVESQS